MGNSVDDLQNLNKNVTPLTENFELVNYPEELLKENGLEEWEDFRNLYESLNRLRNLDLRSVEVNILALSSRLKTLLSKNLPRRFEKPQIRSRLKVVQMQTQKSRYFTKHYKKDSLIPSLKAVYSKYNSLIYRMMVLNDEISSITEGKKVN